MRSSYLLQSENILIPLQANYLLTSSFSSIQKLDCSDNGRQVLKTLLVIAKMKDLQELRVEVSEQSGKRAINAVAKLTNLTRLHFRLAEVSTFLLIDFILP